MRHKSLGDLFGKIIRRIFPFQAKEIECQKCRKFQVTVMKPKLFKECHPVFDEKCKTKYNKHCTVTERCTMVYQTVCNSDYGGGYHKQQVCKQVGIAVAVTRMYHCNNM